MAVDITALYCCLDDFCKVFADWEAHRLLPSEQTRQRSGKLSRAEMLFIIVLFHLSPYKNFKVFYLYGIGCSAANRVRRLLIQFVALQSAVSIAPALTSCRTMTASSA